MALLTDGLINTNGDLQKYENGILDLASTEAIDVSAKAMLAQDEIATELQLFLNRTSHWDPRFFVGQRFDINQVVVTGPLRRWHAYRTLALVYQDAYNNQLNDRYKGKWTEYDKLSAAAAKTLFEVGAGMVYQPLPKAPEPSLSMVPMAVTGTNYFARISWVSASGQEGAASDVVHATSGDGSAVQLTPPISPAAVELWNVYAGTGPDNVQLQNSAPLKISDSWMLPSSGLRNGRLPGTGQSPGWWVLDRHVLPRG